MSSKPHQNVGKDSASALRLTTEEIRLRVHKINPLIKLLLRGFVYKNNKDRIECLCRKCQHRWKVSVHNLLQKNPTGCPQCRRNQGAKKRSMSFDEVESRLKEVGLLEKVKLLSVENGNGRGKNLKCELKCRSCSHRWKTPLCSLIYNFKHGKLKTSGCPQCKLSLPSQNKLSLENVQSKLKQRTDLEVLNYNGNKNKVGLKCKKCGNNWSAFMSQLIPSKSSTRPPQWCSICRPHKFGASEEEVRQKIESLTGRKFPKASPKQVPWLNGLYLDGYCAELNTAFEHQGRQHYEVTSLISNDSKEKLTERKKRDLRKRIQCWRHGVKLIVIPYWIKRSKLRSYIAKRLFSSASGLFSAP